MDGSGAGCRELGTQLPSGEQEAAQLTPGRSLLYERYPKLRLHGGVQVQRSSPWPLPIDGGTRDWI